METHMKRSVSHIPGDKSSLISSISVQTSRYDADRLVSTVHLFQAEINVMQPFTEIWVND